ncbi:hypothetical protein [Maribacter sp. 2308TA10-17]|uniref:hypothetical protein n=1 Tax=Maribacter sp. 2308TA10-17 TaxID=3386276 RepID=UPI0039BD5F10
MKKIIFFFLISISPLMSNGQGLIVENDSLILWQKERLLTWEDFIKKGEKPKDIHLIHQVAETVPEMMVFYIKDDKGNENPVPLCYFQKYSSWSVTSDKETLEHEQLHFDIMELYTRKLRKKFKELLSLDAYTTSETFNYWVNKVFLECKNIQDKYDEEALLNYPKQQEWRKCIDKELEELKEYEFIPKQ